MTATGGTGTTTTTDPPEAAPGPPGPSRWAQVRDLAERADGWLLALAVTTLAAVLRLVHLGRPQTLVFDETYYVKDAWTLLNLGYEAQWPEDPDPAFHAGQVDTYLDDPAYVVHPPAGKWVIALGLRLAGADEPAGWRLGTALAGIVTVLLVARIGRRLMSSTLLGGLAALLIAVDGAALVHSRVAILDGVLTLFVLAGFGALLLDRDHARRRLAPGTAPPRAPALWGPWSWWRPWRLAGGLLLGLAVGTKWSGLWFLAVFGLLTVGWDASTRYRAGIRRWWQAALLRDGPLAFVTVVGAALIGYLASWTGWLRTEGGFGRRWAELNPGEGLTWLPEGLRSLWKYHQDMWGFHTGLTTEHPYAAHPAGWLLQLRPTAFFFEQPEPAQAMCGADACARAITSLGNPLLWWLGSVAVLACVWWVVRHRDGVALAALSGIAAGWLPWFLYAHRTIFAFYVVVITPWLVMCLAWGVGRLLAWGAREPGRAALVRRVVVTGVVLVLLVSAFFWTSWTGAVTSYRWWRLHQWLPGWV
ncbi:dolichyl-phosphate-mannose--protein mannosyltransferase [Cellulomonas bogoriensis]|uniref:Polyprenol-phosphate-mannose--protein mannosyltransferase n=1 Tax=Cellulomonas bogoriensis 69B4 = DSM 16987 TaxID=1386082 RepID=A0A0A0C1V9_9CELL|nr:phospholipid carrier-dependent glycosyltransferase [Cellulomonas bogoriensis]KGM13967.1 membrane protein [Cellulomonas bogoriensis 69B4 = DSM 16987]